MTRHGALYALIGSTLIMSPIIRAYIKYGDLSDESFTRWMLEQSLPEMLKTRMDVFFGFTLISFGLLN